VALRRIGLTPEEAAGKILYSEFEDERIRIQIVGVMEDFHFEDLSTETEPFMVVFDPPGNLSHVIADVQTTNYRHFLSEAENLWSQVVEGVPFEYSFLDDDIAALYTSEQTLSWIISSFTLIAIFISCLGLFGLSAFTAEQRTKEIGIRKVLGASTAGIVTLLSRDFLSLVVVAFVIAAPVAYFVMQTWLEDFAFRVTIPMWIFLLAGGISVLITFATVSIHSMKAALTNPGESLRSE
jgi:putative ABC transport system permease protein